MTNIGAPSEAQAILRWTPSTVSLYRVFGCSSLLGRPLINVRSISFHVHLCFCLAGLNAAPPPAMDKSYTLKTLAFDADPRTKSRFVPSALLNLLVTILFLLLLSSLTLVISHRPLGHGIRVPTRPPAQHESGKSPSVGYAVHTNGLSYSCGKNR